MTPPTLEDVQDELLEQLHAGEAIDRAGVLREHPEHAQALERFFLLLDVIEEPPEGDGAPVPSRLGEFEIVRELGRGGMGVVYEARQASLNRRVALKVLPASLRSDRRLLTRFQREAEAAGRLRHPNIVPVFSVGESGGVPYFAMELVDGGSLADVVRARRAGDPAGLPEEGEAWRRWAVGLVATVADALDHAHGRGIVHRDVKPANILIEADGTPRITDFGLALDLEASELTRSGDVFGSPLYMSPEQAFRRERPLDARTDIYSLAVTLYELLTLEIPYEERTQAAVLSALSEGRVVAPREVDPDMPRALERVLLQALASDPCERYATAAAFAADLRASIDDPAAVTARPPRPAGPARAPRSTFAKVVLVILGILAFFALVAVLGFVFLLLMRGPADSGGPPDRAALTRLADGVDAAETEEHLSRWLQPEFEMRSVVSRAEPGRCRFVVTLEDLPGARGEGFAVDLSVGARVNGREWSPGYAQPPILLGGDGGERSVWLPIDLTELLGEGLEAEMVRVEPRIAFRVARVGADGGSRWTWVGEERSVLVYDEYPADYPARVSNETVDARMREACTPSAIGFGQSWTGASGETVGTTLFFDQITSRPLAGAFEVEVYAGGGAEPLGEFELLLSPRVDDGSTSRVTTGALLERGAGTDAEELAALESVRLLMRPSRDVALEEAGLERYWAGTIDVTVPTREVMSLPTPSASVRPADEPPPPEPPADGR